MDIGGIVYDIRRNSIAVIVGKETVNNKRRFSLYHLGLYQSGFRTDSISCSDEQDLLPYQEAIKLRLLFENDTYIKACIEKYPIYKTK